ncbi:MAG TPA: MoxR family ATPase [Acidimicrobiales bacterium]|nr:MoxR family ATPase [Acidimicrobiales bacterium]
MTAAATGRATAEEVAWFAALHRRLLENVELLIRGKTDEVGLALTCLLAEGHLLIEDVPGVGKTSLAKALASSMGATWHRIQFTPDLLPTDITGVAVWDQRTGSFQFRPGPVFAGIVVGDEINRASPKTQSALLEVMEERQVTVDAVAHTVPRPFMVVATQNPIDLDGTYRLPEAQLDRFLMRMALGYPSAEQEAGIVAARAGRHTPPEVRAVVGVDDVQRMIDVAAAVHVDPALYAYAVEVVTATRTAPDVRLGASPRGTINLVRAAQTRAAAAGRSYVVPEDLKALAVAVLAHRLVLTPDAELAGRRQETVVEGALARVPAPRVGR